MKVEEVLNFDDTICRHKTVDSNVESILLSGIIVKPGEHTGYTFEGISTPDDVEKLGYGEAAAKGDGKTVDFYFQLPKTLLEENNSTIDNLRMKYNEYMNFLIDYVYELNETERSALSYIEMFLFILKDNPILNESNEDYVRYMREKKSASGKVLRVLESLERISLSTRYSSDYLTIIPSFFIKCIGQDDSVIMLNDEYYENLENKDKIIEGIQEHLARKNALSL